MSVRSTKQSVGAVYFCTFTCWKWLPLIERTAAYDAVYRWLWLAEGRGFRTVGFVIMPNHLHVLLSVPSGASINSLLSNAKRFLAYEIVSRLERSGDHALLQELHNGVRPGDRVRGQRHRVFRTSSDIRECLDARMLVQKLDYIHANPVSGRWTLASDALDYPHSSLGFYERGDPTPAPMVHYDLVLHGEEPNIP